MVLESLIKAKNAEKQHLRIFLIGMLYSSVAIIKREFKQRILLDSSILIIIAIAFLFTAYLMEIYVTPRVV